LARSRGWEVVGEYVDNDISAYSGRVRPDFRRLLADVRSGTIDAIICWHMDRLLRRPKELEEVLDIVEGNGVLIATVEAGSIDLSTGAGRATARTLVAWANYESEHKAVRQARGILQKAERGEWRGGGRPFGWGPGDLNRLNRDEARLLRRAMDDVLAGASLASILRGWEAKGIVTSTGRAWSYPTLRMALLRPRNAGISVYRGEPVGRGQWEPLVDEAKWRAVVAIIRDPGRRTATTNVRKYLGSGLFLCGECGATVRSATSGRAHPRPIYRCSKMSGHVYRDISAVDRQVEALVIGRLSQSDAVSLLADPEDPEADGAAAEALAIRLRMKDLASEWALGAFTREQVAQANAELTRHLAAVEERMARTTKAPALRGLVGRGDVAKAWASLTLDRRRSAVDAMIVVTIQRLKDRPDAQGIAIAWRR
jgi:DNA invertase Pin-like site-specific DNA recombinase